MAYNGFTISIAMATYNGELYIRQQLLSILNQSVLPDQIVIADGGSTDKTIDICREVFQEYKNVKSKIIISDDRVLVNENFNRAIANCSGDYIFLSDQDDVWKRKKIEHIMDLMMANDVILSFTNAQIVDKELNIKGDISLWESIGYNPAKDIRIYKKGSYDFLDILLQHNVVTGMTVCFIAGIKDVVMPFSNDVMYDRWIALVALHLGNIMAVNEQLVLYRQHDKNQIGTSTNLKKKILRQKDYHERVLKKIYMVSNLRERIYDSIPENNSELLHSYQKYINVRRAYIEGKISFITLVQNIEFYIKHEYLPYTIFFKDVAYRFIYIFIIKKQKG